MEIEFSYKGEVLPAIQRKSYCEVCKVRDTHYYIHLGITPKGDVLYIRPCKHDIHQGAVLQSTVKTMTHEQWKTIVVIATDEQNS